MNSYEYLQEEAREDGVNVIDYPFDSNRIRGLYCYSTVAIRQDMTTVEKSCVLAEELGHHRMTVGNILDQNDVANRKQEHLARLWAYDRRIGLSGIILGYRNHCHNLHELSECLEVSEEFLNEALECYREKYGCYTELDGYVIMFEPHLAVMEKI